MKKNIPRAIAFVASLIGMIGVLVSLPMLSSFETSLWFMIGASSWGFLIWRLFQREFSTVFLVGWAWCSILHLGMLPLSPLLGRLLGNEMPVPFLIFLMLVLSIAGLFSELSFLKAESVG